MSGMILNEWAQQMFDIVTQVIDIDAFSLSTGDACISERDTAKLVELMQEAGHPKVDYPELGDFVVEYKGDHKKGLAFNSDNLEEEGVYLFAFFDDDFHH